MFRSSALQQQQMAQSVPSTDIEVSATDEIQEKTNYRESSNIKSLCVSHSQCTDWLSAMQNGQGSAQHFSTHQELNQQAQVTKLTATHLNH